MTFAVMPPFSAQNMDSASSASTTECDGPRDRSWPAAPAGVGLDDPAAQGARPCGPLRLRQHAGLSLATGEFKFVRSDSPGDPDWIASSHFQTARAVHDPDSPVAPSSNCAPKFYSMGAVPWMWIKNTFLAGRDDLMVAEYNSVWVLYRRDGLALVPSLSWIDNQTWLVYAEPAWSPSQIQRLRFSFPQLETYPTARRGEAPSWGRKGAPVLRNNYWLSEGTGRCADCCRRHPERMGLADRADASRAAPELGVDDCNWCESDYLFNRELWYFRGLLLLEKQWPGARDVIRGHLVFWLFKESRAWKAHYLIGRMKRYRERLEEARAERALRCGGTPSRRRAIA